MAMDSGLLNRLAADFNAPYIHSDISNLMAIVDIAQDPSSQIQQQLDDTIMEFKNYAKQLIQYEQELYSFCGVNDYQGLNQKLFGTNSSTDTITQMIYRVLREPEFVRSLIPEITSKTLQQTVKVLNNYQNLPQDFFDEFLTKDLTIQTLRDVLLKAMFGNNRSGSISTKDIINLIDPTCRTTIEAEINKLGLKSMQKNAKSRGAGIYKVLRILLENNKYLDLFVKKETFISNFIRVFKNYTSIHQYIIPLDTNYDINEFLEGVASDLYNKLAVEHKLSYYRSNLLGDLAEYGMNFLIEETAYNQLSGTITLETVGAKTEAEVSKLLTSITGQSVALMGFNDLNKASQTDMVLKLYSSQGVKIYRIQSKNSLLEWVDNYDESLHNRPFSIKAGEKDLVKNLLQKLKDKNYLSAEQTGQIAYFLANAAWFNTVGSVKMDNSKKTYNKQRGGTINLSSVFAMAERILTQGIGAFIGLTIDTAMTNMKHGMQVNINASNVFWELGNRTLFPVSEILMSAINIMADLKQNIESSRLHYYIDSKSIQSITQNAKDIFIEKRRSVDYNFDPLGSYTDAGLFAIGQNLGASIMNQLTGYPRLDFQIIRILTSSSWVFSS